jgi:hypothetical protein
VKTLMHVEGVVDENPRKARIRIDLTRRQRAQIRAATGRDVSALDLGLERLPEPASPSSPHPSTDDAPQACKETEQPGTSCQASWRSQSDERKQP